MKLCPGCGTLVIDPAKPCPNCGALPGDSGARGFEYKSPATLFGLPLIHISFKYRSNRTPVVAKGVIAIGQFACGIVTISQLGCGLFSLSQFTLAGFAIAQFGVAYSLLAQFGLFIHQGHGQFVARFTDLLRFFS